MKASVSGIKVDSESSSDSLSDSESSSPVHKGTNSIVVLHNLTFKIIRQ